VCFLTSKYELVGLKLHAIACKVVLKPLRKVIPRESKEWWKRRVCCGNLVKKCCNQRERAFYWMLCAF